MRGSSKTTKKMKQKEKKEDDEVEQLLRAAQDEIMLNLSVNSHIAHHRASPSTADLDLERRFQALKTKTKDQTPQTLVGVDDLAARLDALKAKSSPPPSAAAVAASKLVSDYEEESEDDEEVQIQKLIEWAKDAARLDPSPPSPPESDNDDDDDDHSN
ncbi:uncharacterized protein LOC130739467 [Lotus japonicus]|uniref:uncharacterized protein LOC130739467 n=1 Tax=Lotus japonicus TaxID=34305 RepID=UPI002588A374|nr:uncharacterized protein LOC130739467 [Lotus japonicus]